jgi:hypothetical protein
MRAIGTLSASARFSPGDSTATSKGPTMRTDATWMTTACRSTRATRSTEDARTAEFKTELARLIKKGSTAGISRDDIADELAEAAEALTRVWENDPVGDVIASHRP